MDDVSQAVVAPTQRPDAGLGQVPFPAHVELLEFFLTHRNAIVERIQGVLNAQRKPIEFLQDRPTLSRHFDECFFGLAGLTPDQARLKDQLDEAHWARGFKPRDIPGMHNDLIEPAEMMKRGFHLWSQTRWPGRNGRLRYAHTLFNLSLIRRLALLSMRVWDAGSSSASERLSHVQRVLDELWRGTAADQPVLVRDARWLILVAQSPATDDLSPYFEVVRQVSENLPEDDRIEIQKAAVRIAGAHLRSYLHYYITQKNVRLDQHTLVLGSRKSNALDFSLLIQCLVPLLEAYERALHSGDGEMRLELADAICHGLSADPELFVNRIDLLGVYSMIEHLYTSTDRDGHVVFTSLGKRHVQLLEEYEARVIRLSKPLYEDCPHFRPVDGGYSPYGALFGFSSNLLEHMALKTLQAEPVTGFSLEDVFKVGDADKRAWVSGWRKLPHVEPEVARLYGYPQAFAQAAYERLEHALGRRAHEGETGATARTGRLYILSEDDPQAASKAAAVPDLPARYLASSDLQIVAAGKADRYDPAELLRDRLEGHFLISYETSAGWVALGKDFLTDVLGAGRDVKIAGLPRAAAESLRLMCRDRIAVA
jgi:hypothetical protein